MMYSDDTIAALSTPPGESGVAVIRVSGSEARPILSSVFSNGGRARAANEFEHRRIYHGDLLESGGERIDEVMCAVMRAPESYTGEDTVEVTCHGNTVVVDRVLRRLFECGARAAEPGEFTKRAFLNGKLDLIQAEAVSDLIHSKSDLQRRVAQEQMAGGLSTRINTLADELMELLGVIEANIDFIEDGIDILDVETSLSTLSRHRKELDTLLESAAFARPFREGFRVTIAGPVNAGKSSLFNRLLGERRAIVTDVPGTTRDLIREPIVLEGLLFLLQDTAGLRDTNDRIEQMGV
ncbi:MAG: tRNA uridine-5-carboxymethylaminomethyl(34) synthesis GTPase MnmE, partial [bacterium]|nr:tRNA uridine-5-carboxymethylaminomethyl(34) synthesis GTPase MnmE [bacterium]